MKECISGLRFLLRALMYVGRAYEALTSINSRYRRTLLKIPTPEFYTFYNGNDDYPPETVLRLSDAYIDRNSSDENYQLELLVKVINITQGISGEERKSGNKYVNSRI